MKTFIIFLKNVVNKTKLNEKKNFHVEIILTTKQLPLFT